MTQKDGGTDRKEYMMIKKNRFFLAGLPVIALALGLMVAGCDDGSTDDTNDGGGSNNYPAELIGKWYTSADKVLLEFTSAGKFILDEEGRYAALVLGNTITVKSNSSGMKVGQFDYAISGNKMTISRAGGSMITLVPYSPLTKK